MAYIISRKPCLPIGETQHRYPLKTLQCMRVSLDENIAAFGLGIESSSVALNHGCRSASMVRYPGLQRKAGLASLERSVGEMGMLLRCSACEVMFQKVRANAHVEWVGLRLSLRISTESRGWSCPRVPPCGYSATWI